jgi:glycosyltransferase involved in cell wall biosynthesis
MKVAIVGPIATQDVAHLLGSAADGAPAGYGGAPVLGTLIESLLERGHTVVGITTDVDPNGITAPVVLHGERLDMVYCPQRRHAFRPRAGALGRAADCFAHERRFLSEAIRQSQPDVVHAHWLYEFAWAARQSGLPYVVTAHDSPRMILRYMPNLYRLVRLLMARLTAARAPLFAAVSPYMADELRRITRAPIVVIPNPLPRTAERPATPWPDPRNADAARIVAILNGWDGYKNGATALRALAEVRRVLPSVTLTLFGSACDVGGQANTFALANGLADGVVFRGAVDHAHLMRELPAFDLLLHPALEESFGAAVAEAMALKLPVVGGLHSGAVPWVVGDAGVLVDVRDPMAVASAVLSLLRDPARRLALGEAARRSVLARFSRADVASATEALYRQVLSPRPASDMAHAS